MSQSDFGTIDPDTTSGEDLATILENWRDALHSMHSGASRPSYAVAGMLWKKEISGTQWDVMLYDGAVDILFGSFNPSTGKRLDPSPHNGAAAPATTIAGQYWADLTDNLEKQRNKDDDGWIIRGSLDDDAVVSKSANYTVAEADFGRLILVDATSGGKTITLPAAATVGENFRVTIKKSDASANVVTIDGDGSETIDLALTLALSVQNHAVTLVPDGSNWHIADEHLSALSIVAGRIAADAVTTAKIADDAVTLAKIAHTTANKFFGTDGSGVPALLDGGGGPAFWSVMDILGTFTEIDSDNVSGHIDNGTGDLTVTIDSDMADANYPAVCCPGDDTYAPSGNAFCDAIATTSVNSNLVYGTGGVRHDDDRVNTLGWGALA